MLTIEFDIDEDGYADGFDRYMREGYGPAITGAVNDVALAVRRRLERAVVETFRDPVQYTVHAFGMFLARPDDPDPAAAVFVYPQQAQYLQLEVFGGVRQAGDYGTLPGGVLMPGRDAPLDSHGNLPRDLLADAKADPRVSWVRLGPAGDEVLVRHGAGGTLEFLAEVAPETHYEPALDFYGLAEREVAATLPAAVAEVLAG